MREVRSACDYHLEAHTDDGHGHEPGREVADELEVQSHLLTKVLTDLVIGLVVGETA
jgi:hypothetical protein